MNRASGELDKFVNFGWQIFKDEAISWASVACLFGHLIPKLCAGPEIEGNDVTGVVLRARCSIASDVESEERRTMARLRNLHVDRGCEAVEFLSAGRRSLLKIGRVAEGSNFDLAASKAARAGTYTLPAHVGCVSLRPTGGRPDQVPIGGVKKDRQISYLMCRFPMCSVTGDDPSVKRRPIMNVGDPNSSRTTPLGLRGTDRESLGRTEWSPTDRCWVFALGRKRGPTTPPTCGSRAPGLQVQGEASCWKSTNPGTDVVVGPVSGRCSTERGKGGRRREGENENRAIRACVDRWLPAKIFDSNPSRDQRTHLPGMHPCGEVGVGAVLSLATTTTGTAAAPVLHVTSRHRRKESPYLPPLKGRCFRFHDCDSGQIMGPSIPGRR